MSKIASVKMKTSIMQMLNLIDSNDAVGKHLHNMALILSRQQELVMEIQRQRFLSEKVRAGPICSQPEVANRSEPPATAVAVAPSFDDGEVLQADETDERVVLEKPDANVFGQKRKDVQGEPNQNVLGQKRKDMQEEPNQNVLGQKRKDVQENPDLNVLGQKQKDVQEEPDLNVLGQKQKDVQEEPDLNVLGQKRKDMPKKPNQNVLGQKQKDVQENPDLNVLEQKQKELQEKPDPNVLGQKRKAEMPLISSNDHSQPFDKMKEWTCALCQVTVRREGSFKQHLRGKKHQHREEDRLRTRMASNVSRATQEQLPNKRRKLSSGSVGAKEHESKVGRTLQCDKTANFMELYATQDVHHKFKFWCEKCKVGVYSSINMLGHLNGKKHRANHQE